MGLTESKAEVLLHGFMIYCWLFLFWIISIKIEIENNEKVSLWPVFNLGYLGYFVSLLIPVIYVSRFYDYFGGGTAAWLVASAISRESLSRNVGPICISK